jgi:hypothetical protein
MHTHPIRNSSGHLLAFEVGNTLIGPATFGRIMESKLGARIIPKPWKKFKNADVRLGFELRGDQFIVVEPYGDNSRYWVGPVGDELVHNPIIDLIHAAIGSYTPSPLGWLRTFLRTRDAHSAS